MDYKENINSFKKYKNIALHKESDIRKDNYNYTIKKISTEEKKILIFIQKRKIIKTVF